MGRRATAKKKKLWLSSATCRSQLPFHQDNVAYITVRTGGRGVWQGHDPVPLRFRQSHTLRTDCAEFITRVRAVESQLMERTQRR